MALSLRRGLEAEGYAVEVAVDGEDGLWQAVEHDFDAVVLDVMLPKRNGYEMLRELRQAGRDVPVLMLTAKDGEWDQASTRVPMTTLRNRFPTQCSSRGYGR